MKKFAILAALAITALGFASCSDDKDPVYQQPAEGSFVLNTPAMANQTYDLATCGPVVLTTSQPDYGFTASVNYRGQMAVGNNEPTEATPTFNLVANVPTSAVVSFNPTDIATGMCVLNGIANEADWAANPVLNGKVWIRVIAQIGEYSHTEMVSNWVALQSVTPFFAVPQPGKIYLVGTPCGWPTPDEGSAEVLAEWALTEPTGDGIGSKIYYGTFDIPAAPIFRFYVKLTGWDGGDSWGTQVDDSPISFDELDDSANPTFTHEIVNGKGSFEFPNWPGGTMTIVVDMNTHTASFMAGSQQ